MEKEVFNRSRSPGARAWWGARAEPWAPMVVGATVPATQLPANYSWAQPGRLAALSDDKITSRRAGFTFEHILQTKAIRF